MPVGMLEQQIIYTKTMTKKKEKYINTWWHLVRGQPGDSKLYSLEISTQLYIRILFLFCTYLHRAKYFLDH